MAPEVASTSPRNSTSTPPRAVRSSSVFDWKSESSSKPRGPTRASASAGNSRAAASRAQRARAWSERSESDRRARPHTACTACAASKGGAMLERRRSQLSTKAR